MYLLTHKLLIIIFCDEINPIKSDPLCMRSIYSKHMRNFDKRVISLIGQRKKLLHVETITLRVNVFQGTPFISKWIDISLTHCCKNQQRINWQRAFCATAREGVTSLGSLSILDTLPSNVIFTHYIRGILQLCILVSPMDYFRYITEFAHGVQLILIRRLCPQCARVIHSLFRCIIWYGWRDTTRDIRWIPYHRIPAYGHFIVLMRLS